MSLGLQILLLLQILSQSLIQNGFHLPYDGGSDLVERSLAVRLALFEVSVPGLAQTMNIRECTPKFLREPLTLEANSEANDGSIFAVENTELAAAPDLTPLPSAADNFLPMLTCRSLLIPKC